MTRSRREASLCRMIASSLTVSNDLRWAGMAWYGQKLLEMAFYCLKGLEVALSAETDSSTAGLGAPVSRWLAEKGLKWPKKALLGPKKDATLAFWRFHVQKTTTVAHLEPEIGATLAFWSLGKQKHSVFEPELSPSV